VNRRSITAAVAAATCLLLSACTSVLNAPIPGADTGLTLSIGMVVSRTGANKAIGDEMLNGLQLYLEEHEGKLGGYSINLIVEDEGDSGGTARTAAEKLIIANRVVALTGLVGGGSVTAIKPLLDQHSLPLIGVNRRPTNMTDLTWVWHSSYLANEPGLAMGGYVAKNSGGPVWVICSDDQEARDECAGFVEAFTKAGGKVANPGGKVTWAPAAGASFQPQLAQILESDAKAVYGSYAGDAAVAFVQQYAQSVGGKLPLFAAGFLTEGPVLEVQGDAAKGIRSGLNYAPDLDNRANGAFVAAYHTKHNSLPSTFSMAAYDAGAMLDKAIAAAAAAGGQVSGASLNSAIAGLGQIDSPRGPWQLSAKTHTPVQPWYLREVHADGRTLSNILIQELDTIGG
jgi:branched-chain amino acid transport system substrate-binding protein